MNLRLAIIIASISGGLMLLTIIASFFIGTNATPINNTNIIPTTIPVPTASYIAPSQNLQPSPGKSLITGQLCPETPGGIIPPSIIIAESLPSRQKTTKFFPGTIATKETTYALELDPGTYEIYTQDSTQEKLALYSANVTCGGHNYCNTHTLISLELQPNQKTSDINICDYTWKDQFTGSTNNNVLISPTPSTTPINTSITISPTTTTRSPSTNLTPTSTPTPINSNFPY